MSTTQPTHPIIHNYGLERNLTKVCVIFYKISIGRHKDVIRRIRKTTKGIRKMLPHSATARFVTTISQSFQFNFVGVCFEDAPTILLSAEAPTRHAITTTSQ